MSEVKCSKRCFKAFRFQKFLGEHAPDPHTGTFSHKWRGGKTEGGRREMKGNASCQTAVKREKF